MGKGTIQKIAQTPRGTLEWCFIRGEGKEDLMGNFKYQVNLVLDPENVPEDAEFIKRIDEFWADNKPAHIKEAKSVGYYPHKVKTDEVDDDGEAIYKETGKTVLVFKTATEFKDGKKKLVKVFNSSNVEQQVTDNIIGNDSIGRVSGAMDIYEVVPKSGKGKAVEAGVTLYLDAVKVLKLVKYEAGPQFGDEDAGYEDGWGGEDDGWEGHEEAAGSAEAKTEAKAKDKPRI